MAKRMLHVWSSQKAGYAMKLLTRPALGVSVGSSPPPNFQLARPFQRM